MAEFPTRQMLDGVAGDRPVALTSRDGHVAWLNTAGMRELGLSDRVEAVEGGEVVTGSGGRPTGIFKENAATLVWTKLGDRNQERTIDTIARGAQQLRRLGLAGAHTLEDQIGTSLLAQALARGTAGINLVRLREVHEPEELDALEPMPGASCIKTYADGALGSQTASMLESYCGEPDNFGIPALTPAKLREIVFRAVAKGFGVAVHAIGDRASREVLNVYEEVRRRPEYRGTLLRLEHAQVLARDDIPRLARQGIVASMQPIHLVSDRYVADRYWGKRSANAYAWKRIMDAGGTVAFGSDAPIESPDPLRGIHAAVTRSDPATPEEGPWYPEERLEVWQAVDCYTLGSAAAARAGADLDRGADGRICAGAPANLTILDRDIIGSADPQVLLDAGVVGTVVAGEPDLMR
jgi:predicted amidohydrolase YtcJ